jgi:UDP-N-acetylglucosamine transferase subunit ALG13
LIFVTVGAQMPFYRMVSAIDRWARSSGCSDVLAQIGPTDWRPAHIRWTQFLEPAEFRQQVESASVVIAHAGMGSILTALELGKPIIVMPRRGELRETRNDHQVATARQLLAHGRVHVAFDEAELLAKLERVDSIRAAERISPYASPQLIGVIREFITSRGVAGGVAGGVGQRAGSGWVRARARWRDRGRGRPPLNLESRGVS